MEKFTTQIKLTIMVFGDSFLPADITNLINISPTNSWVKGDGIPLQKGLSRKDNNTTVRHESVWEFSTEFVKTQDFEDVSCLFEKEFEHKTSILKAYIEAKKLEIAINIILEIADDEIPSIHLNKRIIKICKELDAEIDIDMYLLKN